MVGNGGGSSGPSEAGGSNGQTQGTEYTLQGMAFTRATKTLRGTASTFRRSPKLTSPTPTGVMRFLQTEWHRHERDRNAWQIERAEMKSRIGKLEGDGRTSKRLQESLGKHVRLLENALKKEREKVKALQSGQASEETKSEAQSPKEGAKPNLKRRFDTTDDSAELIVVYSRDLQASQFLPGHRA